MQALLRLRDEGELNDEQAKWFREFKDIEELFDTLIDPHELNNLAKRVLNPKWMIGCCALMITPTCLKES